MMRFVWGVLILLLTPVFRLLWRLGWTDPLDESKSAVIVNDPQRQVQICGTHAIN